MTVEAECDGKSDPLPLHTAGLTKLGIINYTLPDEKKKNRG